MGGLILGAKIKNASSYFLQFIIAFSAVVALLAGPLSQTAFAAPPDTVIDAGPDDYSSDATPSFTFSSSDVAATFECQIDSGPYNACVSPYTTPALSEGQHTFSVRSTNLLAETDLTPATQAWEFVQFDSGDGTSIDPYVINACNQLALASGTPTSHFIMNSNIDCDGVAVSPIGTGATPFEGSFDGNGFKISNLTISGADEIGLFGYAASSVPFTSVTIQNVRIEGANINGDNNVGVLVGQIAYADISNVRITDSVVTASGNNSGGMVGYLGAGTITTSSYKGTVSSSGNNVGGIAGYIVGPTFVDNSLSVVTIGGADNVGGLVGLFDTGAGSGLDRSYSVATFTSSTGDRGGTIGLVASGGGAPTNTNTFSVHNISGSMTNGNSYKNSSSYDVLSTWSFGPSSPWHVNYNDYPSLSPIFGPQMVCEAPIQYLKSIHTACDYEETGWGTTTWEAQYQEDGAATWIPVTLSNVHSGSVTVTGTRSDKDYNVRLRYTNDSGTSSWGVVEFLSIGAGDFDTDGVNDHLENSAPNDGDGNNDGSYDSVQANVYSNLDTKSDEYFALVTPDCNDNFNVQVGEQPSSLPDAGHTFLTGLVHFVGRNCGSAGSAVPVELYFYGDYDVDSVTLRKFDSETSTYSSIPDVTYAKLTIGGQSVLKASYTVVDGGPLDGDGAADGNIVDPVGLASLPQSPNTGLQQKNMPMNMGILLVGVAMFGYVAYDVRRERL